jgi:hypothetical protein
MFRPGYCFTRVEVHCGTGYKDNLRELIEYIVPPAKGALVENEKIRYITV